jgi:N,N-dimethylformamidase beta subunit-like, C-terminal
VTEGPVVVVVSPRSAIVAALAVAVAVPALVGGAATTRPGWEKVTGVPATFTRDSYRPGQVAWFELWRRERSFTLQFFRVAPAQKGWTRRTMQGTPVSRVYRYGRTPAHRPLALRIGKWPSGLYYAELESGGLTGFAPFVVRPPRLGGHRVLVILPTYTWQAYNFRDDNHDGHGDTWYAAKTIDHVRLDRPYLSRGVPPHFATYDLPFLQWLEQTGKQVDFISDSDLDAVYGPRTLHRAYTLVVFPGHHEYVTAHEKRVVTGYRNLGGHLMFLSANDFFWQVRRDGDVLTRRYRWRHLGQPEASLIGVQFFRNDGGAHHAPWRVVNLRRWPWLWRHMDLHVGSQFGMGGIEIDHVARSSPPGTTVVADIPNLMGRGDTAQMTYYQTASGAKVFAAGAFTLGGARDPVSCRLLQNLWLHLGPPAGREPGGAQWCL